MSKFRKESGPVTPKSASSLSTSSLSDINISRRGMMKVFSAGAALSTGIISLPNSAWAAEAKPVKGGTLRAAVSNSSAADTLDPARANNSGDYMRQYMFYSGLTELDTQLIPQMGLAESMTSEDGLTWSIKLRQGVTFHDGKSLTSQDVMFSLLRHKDPAVASTAIALAKQFVTVKAVGLMEVEIKLDQPNFDLPSILGTPAFLIVQDGTKDFSKAIGTGPYSCKEFSPGTRTLGTRNKNFWKPGLPHLDQVELLGVTDQAARVNALLSGELHFVSTISSRDVKRINGSNSCSVLESKSGMYSDLILRQDAAITRNPDFVLAMKYLQPREVLLKTVMQGFGTLANDHPVPPWHPFFNKDLPQRPNDLDKARFYLKKSGLVKPSLEIVATDNIEGSVEGAQFLQQLGSQVGMNLKVRRVPYDNYWSQHWMKHPISYGSVNPRPTLDMLFSQFYKSDAPWNESGWKNVQFDQLVTAARGERDQAKRKQMYGDMQALVYNHCGTIIPLFISSLDGYSNKVKGVESYPSGMMMGYRFSEFVWLAS
ncbi:ABC transporter substrate-binding protein [Hafnia psychrotolerans]|uniref:ABC transporter substrate-binding protein n=1 Tax=Hafnia psychrotolerans TaxID=1477018 RepID=A0ABQ1G3K7_9GAMM|nr:ABC transporter substrate-binding protein [Hafnia psychrotolerans]GGA36720.1 ABC transporter substrate-binding protein [Hafnia psychrotolerans]